MAKFTSDAVLHVHFGMNFVVCRWPSQLFRCNDNQRCISSTGLVRRRVRHVPRMLSELIFRECYWVIVMTNELYLRASFTYNMVVKLNV